MEIKIEKLVEIMQSFSVDTYTEKVYVVCGKCDNWSQSFPDGARFDELVIAAMSHFDKVHQ